MFWLQPTFLILVLLSTLVIFGTAYLPEFGQWLGRWLKEFKHATGARAGGRNSGR